jgi:hypothetical protein
MTRNYPDIITYVFVKSGSLQYGIRAVCSEDY